MKFTNRVAAVVLGCTVSASIASAGILRPAPGVLGLAPFSRLLQTPAGRAALLANYRVTGAIQRGSQRMAPLESLVDQRARALRDATVTGENGVALSDGLGSTLFGAYTQFAGYSRVADGKIHATAISPGVTALFAVANARTAIDSAFAKKFYANAPEVRKLGGDIDEYGKAYHRLAGSIGADRFGNSRPFQTEISFATFSGRDYFYNFATNDQYLRGPLQNASDSPAFPSGHTTYAYTESLLFAMMVPERYPNILARAAEYGDNRIILGAHYAMDIIGGRTLAEYDIAQKLGNPTFRDLLSAARKSLRKKLTAECSASISVCAKIDHGRFSNPATDLAFIKPRLTYGLPPVWPNTTGKVEDVGTLAPEAGRLLTVAFPNVTLAAADRALTATESPGGGFLDDGSRFGVYSRLDIARAAMMLTAFIRQH